MRIGFTGTQRGMTDKQKMRTNLKLVELGATEFHHGDCIGADDEAHDIALFLHIPIIIHPPLSNEKQAYCQDSKFVHPPKPYLERNHDIVNAVDFMIATPGENTEQLRSGTWATIRYARKLNKPGIISSH